MSFNWFSLQNGSDIRGVALEGIDGETVNFDVEKVKQIAIAFLKWLKNRGLKIRNIAVGMDSRLSGPKLKQGFIEGVTAMGGNVIDCGLASTPAMFMITKDKELDVQGAVMLTASHLPFNRNGMKFFTENGGLNKNDIREILSLTHDSEFVFSEEVNSIQEINFIDRYAANMVEKIREAANDPINREKPLDGLKIIVDAGNGAGGFFVDKVLVPLGANVEGSQFLEPDGMFPNHIPNPEDKEAMASICKAVIDKKADLGIIFDTDVDRAAVVDKSGKPINRNALIALMSVIVLEESPGSTIVTDSVTSDGLTVFIEQVLRGKHHRFKRGYKNVIDESIRLNKEGVDSPLAIETSGHAALKENYFLDDGAYLIARVLIKTAQIKNSGESISNLIERLQQPIESEEYRLPLKAEDHVTTGNMILEQVAEKAKVKKGWDLVSPNYEGVRVSCESEKGWFLLRLSLHDPLMVLNIESDVEGGCEKIMNGFNELVKGIQEIS